MIKQTIQYTDFNGEPASETVYFNLSKADMTDHLDFMDDYKELEQIFAGEVKELTRGDTMLLLKFIKSIMKLSYGVKSADGKRFQKSEELWNEFTETAAYDAFLFSLFSEPEKANDFLMNVFPKDLLEQAQLQQQLEAAGTPAPTAPSLQAVPDERKQVTPDLSDKSVPEGVNIKKKTITRKAVTELPSQIVTEYMQEGYTIVD